jgi:hypothetical protein
MSWVDAFLLGRTKIPRELHNAHFFSIHATKSRKSPKFAAIKKTAIKKTRFKQNVCS